MPNRKLSPRVLSSRIDALRRRHRELDDKVSLEQQRPVPDTGRLQTLKRERLSLKDAIRAAQSLLLRTTGRPRQFS